MAIRALLGDDVLSDPLKNVRRNWQEEAHSPRHPMHQHSRQTLPPTPASRRSALRSSSALEDFGLGRTKSVDFREAPPSPHPTLLPANLAEAARPQAQPSLQSLGGYPAHEAPPTGHMRIVMPQPLAGGKLGLVVKHLVVVAITDPKASQFGFLPGDRVLAVNDHPVGSSPEFFQEVSAAMAENQRTGMPVIFDIWRKAPPGVRSPYAGGTPTGTPMTQQPLTPLTPQLSPYAPGLDQVAREASLGRGQAGMHHGESFMTGTPQGDSFMMGHGESFMMGPPGPLPPVDSHHYGFRGPSHGSFAGDPAQGSTGLPHSHSLRMPGVPASPLHSTGAGAPGAVRPNRRTPFSFFGLCDSCNGGAVPSAPLPSGHSFVEAHRAAAPPSPAHAAAAAAAGARPQVPGPPQSALRRKSLCGSPPPSTQTGQPNRRKGCAC